MACAKYKKLNAYASSCKNDQIRIGVDRYHQNLSNPFTYSLYNFYGTPLNIQTV